MKRHTITGLICLLLSFALMYISTMDFLQARKPDEIYPGEGVTQIKMLSDYFPDLANTNGDTEIYVMEGENPGASILVLGGTHGYEPAGYFGAIALIENALPKEGTLFVIPAANRSTLTHNEPLEATPLYMDITTESGVRQFRFGSRGTNPVDQWPDPDVYIHAASGQQLSGADVRNLNRAFPGRPDGTFTEKVAYGIVSLINEEEIDITVDLHEASPEYPVNNTLIVHETGMDLASMAVLQLKLGGIDISLEQSPTELRGLSHRELGDHTDTIPILLETNCPSIGRMRGETNAETVLSGKDDFYVKAAELGFVSVPYDETGEPIEKRVGRHLQSIIAIIEAYTDMYSEPIVIENIPTYAQLFSDSDGSDLGGERLGTFLN